MANCMRQKIKIDGSKTIDVQDVMNALHDISVNGQIVTSIRKLIDDAYLTIQYLLEESEVRENLITKMEQNYDKAVNNHQEEMKEAEKKIGRMKKDIDELIAINKKRHMELQALTEQYSELLRDKERAKESVKMVVDVTGKYATDILDFEDLVLLSILAGIEIR